MKIAFVIFLFSFIIVTILVGPFREYQSVEKEANISKQTANNLSSSNAYLNGVIDGNKSTVQSLQKELEDNRRDAQTASLNSKTDLNEANRQRDVALQRLDYFESNPEKLSNIYSNIFAHTPTNFQQVDLMFAQFNAALSNNITEIETTAKQFQQNASLSQFPTGQIADLDQKTEDLEKLPDGRTMFGGVLAGTPKVILELFNSAARSYSSSDFNTALISSQKAIKALDSSAPTGVFIDTSTRMSPHGEKLLYLLAASSAIRLGSNNIANEYAKRADKIEPDAQTKCLVASTLGNLAIGEFAKNNITNSFKLYQEAIANYESITNYNESMSDVGNLLILYAGAANAAFHIGKMDEGIRFATKASDYQTKMKNAH